MDEDLTLRVARLEATQEILRRQLEYTRALDVRDFAALGLLFTEDSEWVGGLGHMRGPLEIIETFKKTLGLTGGVEYHVMLNQVVVELGSDEAAAECAYAVVSRGDDNSPYIRMYGTYDDILVRTSTGWRFKLRKVTPVLRTQLSTAEVLGVAGQSS